MYDSNDSKVLYALRFGEIAIEKGFITLHELEEALQQQISADSSVSANSRKKIGEILFDKGFITFDQIKIVLEEIFDDKNQLF